MTSATPACAHSGTPTLQVSDARGLAVRAVQFHRRNAHEPVDTRVTQQRFDAAGRLIAHRDPHLFELANTDTSAPHNLHQVPSLSGARLLTVSVDAGWRVALLGEAGQHLEAWDGRGGHTRAEYDQLLRPVVLREGGADIPEHVIERLTYADSGPDAATDNLCGQLIRHDDPAGTVLAQQADLSGRLLKHTRRFLTGTKAPDWPLAIAARDALLEPDNGMTTANTYAASGEMLSQTDAMGNVQSSGYDRAGQLKDTRLTLAGTGQNEKLLVSDLHYNATGQVEAETAGNGVITRHHYDAVNGRLIELSAHKPDGTPLQRLQYQHDAVGNVLSIEDAAQPIRYFNNQRIEPVKTYRYDTLDQLIEATGSEALSASGGPALPDLQPLPLDPGQIANYTQHFHYDAGGNLLDLVHVGVQAQGRTLTRAKYSNRCLPEREGRPPTEAELAAGFDANGNLRELQPGQQLSWNLRNQLCEVRPVVREDAEDDRECYVYDGSGLRVRKVHSSATNARILLREVRYLPGLEIRHHQGTGATFHVINASAGSNSVQVLHWVEKRPAEVAQDQVRYGSVDHLESIALELDDHADLISREEFYCYGGTAYWAARSESEAKCKTRRYSGEERDSTGLLCYGLRYYMPWLQRWINPDPAGDGDGLNRYRMVRNNPVNFVDRNGLESTIAQKTSGLTSFHLSFIDKDPAKRLVATPKQTQRRLAYVESKLRHNFNGYTSESRIKQDEFKNSFERHTWTLKINFRISRINEFFASDVAIYQYSQIAGANGFLGELPSKIIRSQVENRTTIEKTEDLANGSEALLKIFMEETPNGRSTQRILDAFGLKATRVDKQETETWFNDFIVSVEPLSKGSTRLNLTPDLDHVPTRPNVPAARSHQRAMPAPSLAPYRNKPRSSLRPEARAAANRYSPY